MKADRSSVSTLGSTNARTVYTGKIGKEREKERKRENEGERERKGINISFCEG